MRIIAYFLLTGVVIAAVVFFIKRMEADSFKRLGESQKRLADIAEKNRPPKHQEAINLLVDQYMAANNIAKNEIERDKLKEEYELKIMNYLKDSADMKMGGFKVKVTNVLSKRLASGEQSLEVRATDRNITYYCGIKFKNPKIAEESPSYNYVASLNEGEVAEVSFVCSGGVDLSTYGLTTIDVIPVPDSLLAKIKN